MSLKPMKPLKYKGSTVKPIEMVDGKIVFNNTKNLKWDKGWNSKKNHITVSVVGDSEKMKSQSVIYNDGGVSPSVIDGHQLYSMYWKDKYPNKVSNKDDFQFHIPMDEIKSYDDIFRLTKSGKYSHLHQWNEDGEVHNIIPIIWTYEKKSSKSSWGDFSHSMECVYLMRMFDEFNHIETMRNTSDVEVIDFDELGEGIVCIVNPKMDGVRFLNQNDEYGNGLHTYNLTFGDIIGMDDRKREILIKYTNIGGV